MALHDLPRQRLTYDDYVLIPDDGKRHEIIDGEHYVTAAPFLRHQRIVLQLTGRLWSFVQNHPLGEVFISPADVVLSPYDVLQPDLFFIANARSSIAEVKNVQGAPDLVIEIHSDSTRRIDQGVKRAAYERWGVTEYWMLDPARKEADVWERTAEGLGRRALLSAAAGDVLTTPLLPGLEIPLAEVLKD
ncbi:MAG TPA: Uma2 family endonuclease [Thermoanaerobaculia bacterium]|jgi:Uma2 family endonuclease|nr:Uma2 family endonuclease [Thermoanaerobaculia bacterium]